MKRITWTWQKIVALIAGFFGIGTLVSCYGMPYDSRFSHTIEDEYRVFGGVYGDLDEDPETLESIRGIRVSALGESDITDATGTYYLSLYEQLDEIPETFDIIFEDIDGEANGSFENQVITVNKRDRPGGHDVILTKKE